MIRNRMTHPELMDELARREGIGGLRDMGEERVTSSASVLEIMLRAGMKFEDVETSGRVSFAMMQWHHSGKPILHLSPELQQMLLATDLPKSIEELPELSFDGFYLVVPGGFFLSDPVSGLHEIEGIYLCRDRWIRRDGIGEIEDGILVCAIGEDKGNPDTASGQVLNDSIHFFGLLSNEKLDRLTNHKKDGLEEVLRIVINLILLWDTEESPVTQKVVKPPEKKSPKKQKRMARRHISNLKYIELGVRPGYWNRSVVGDVPAGEGPVHVTMVRGHFRTYWVCDAKEARVLDTRKSAKDVTTYKVRKFIKPHAAYRRGEALTSNNYEVRHVV